MKAEDEQLILLDLCTRLPHKVKVQYDKNCIGTLYGMLDAKTFVILTESNKYECRKIQDFSIFLRPLTSLIGEEYKQYQQYSCFGASGYTNDRKMITAPNYERLDFLNSNHFDYRGLIPKGLAIAVTKDNNPYK